MDHLEDVRRRLVPGQEEEVTELEVDKTMLNSEGPYSAPARVALVGWILWLVCHGLGWA